MIFGQSDSAAAMMMAAAMVLSATVSLGGDAASAAAPAKVRVYVGTYTGKESKGIYLMHLDLASGRLSDAEVAAEVANPSFVAIHPSRRFLYAVGELGEFGGKKTGAVSALAIDPKTGKLTLLNQQSSQGTGPCHVSLDRSGKWALVANYGGGSVACLPIGDDGRLGEATAFIQHHGSGPNLKRQAAPHAHSINLDPANRFAFVADLGLDKVLVYRFDSAQGKLTANDRAFGEVPPGSGPRHFAFHPNGRYAYVINELASTVTAFAYDAPRGSLRPLQTIGTLPADYHGGNSTAEVQVHPSGKFLYGSNRGHDSIAIFTIDGEGKLCHVGNEPTQGKTPRNFGIDPTGRYLLAAHQDSGNVVVFRIDPQSGKLQPTGQSLKVPASVCVKMMAE